MIQYKVAIVMEIKIKQIEPNELETAIGIFTECFLEEPLHILAFPEIEKRRRCTRLVYELVVYHLVPGLKMKIIGAYIGGNLVGALDYTPPNQNALWSEELDEAVKDMRRKANDEAINIIGEFAQISGMYKPEETHFYINDVAVLKEFRGKGIAGKLFEHVENECRAHPEAVCTALDATSPKNVSLYEHWGYKIYKEIPFHDITCHKMKKQIK